MATTTPLQCPHCGRSNFRSNRGLQQHLRSSGSCKEKHEALLTANANAQREAELNRAREALLQEANKPKTRSQARAALANDATVHELHHDQPTSLFFAHALAEGNHNTDSVQPADDTDAYVNDFGPPDDADAQAPEHGDGSDANLEVNVDDAEVDDSDEEHKEPVPSSKGLSDFKHYCETHKFFAPLSRAETRGIMLMDVLRSKKAPMNAYGRVMEWHLRETGGLSGAKTLKDAASAGDYVGRDSLMRRLADRYNMAHKKPKEKTVKLPFCKEVVKIPVCDAEDCIVQLLTHPLLEDEDFNFFNDDPLAPPQDLDYIGDNITGSAYKETHKRLITGPNQQLIGVIFYIDGATTGHFVDLPVTAVKMSLSCFTREARLKEHMWATLGYIPQVKVAEGRGKKLFRESQHLEAEDVDLLAGEGEISDLEGELTDDSDNGFTNVKAQDFHFMLSIILESFVDPILSNGMLWDLVYKGKVYPGIHLKFFISLIRSDTEEADALCGKYQTRTRNIKHLCRQCHVPTLEASNYRANYKPKTQKHIENLVKKKKLDSLKDISQHYLKNAWYKCRFNLANNRGVHGACPVDMLHGLQLGIMKYCRDIWFSQIGKDAAVAQDINGLARVYGGLLAHQSDRDLPATNFSKGIRDGKLMAKDYRGVLLIMAAVLVSTKGREMLSTKRKFKKDERKDDWILLVELLLEWEAYLCQPRMKKSQVARLGMKNRYIMYIMTRVAKRSEGMGLNLMKFHAIVHLMDDISINGVPLEFDTAANESHHKPSKYAAQLTQRNEATFQRQVSIRLWEFQILDHALEEIRSDRRLTDYFLVDTDQPMDDISSSQGSKSHSHRSEEGSSSQSSEGPNEPKISTDDAMIRVWWDEDDNSVGFNMVSKSQFAKKTQMNSELLQFLYDLQVKTKDYLQSDFLPIFTRHQRGDVIFHAHPNYRGQGPWRDWAVIDWGAGYGQLPCHLHAFVELEGMPTGQETLEYGSIRLTDGVFAVVEEARIDENELGRSDLFVPFLKTVREMNDDGAVVARTFYLAPTEAIVKPCAMVADIGGPKNRYFYVKPREEWSKMFAAWLNRPHHEDEMSDVEDEDN